MSFWKKKGNEELESPRTTSSNVDKPVSTGSVASALSKAPTSNTTPAASSTGSSIEKDANQQECSSLEEHLNQKYGRVRSALGAGTVIQGKLSFDTPVRIDGKLSGEIFSSKALIVGPTGQIDAKVEVACLVIMGSVKGNVKASERIELLAGGQLEGEISTQVFVIESGARFTGGCSMGGKARAKTEGTDSKKTQTSETTVLNNPNVDLSSVLNSKDTVASKPETKKVVPGVENATTTQPRPVV
jgi:cytoskeletal protein CcmA (bactofilin family)